MAITSLQGCSGSKPSDDHGVDDTSTDDDESPAKAPDAGGRKPKPTEEPDDTKTDPDTKPDPDKPRNPSTVINLEPIAIDDCGDKNAAGVSSADAVKLKASGGSADGMKWLYPYDGTVFPRGMLAPDLMWNGPAGEAVYVHIKSKNFEYWTCLKPTAAGRITLDHDVWEKAGQRSAGKQDIYELELSVISQGKVTGPVKSTFQIAQAAIKGSIYYNTYSSKLAVGGAAGGLPGVGGGFPGIGGGFPGGGGFGGGSGVVLRIPAGGKAEVFGQTDCNGCLSVSADGSRLIAASAGMGTYSYKIVDDGPAPMPVRPAATGLWTAIYPDGSAFLTMSTAVDVARTQAFGGLGGLGGGGGSGDATLYDSTTGEKIESKGIPPGALMPFFSPDGTRLVFNDVAIDQAHGIAVMQYDTQTHTATEYAVLHKEPAGAMRPGWPFFLPDNHGVVFLRTSSPDFTGGGQGISGGILGGAAAAPHSELSIADLDSKKVTLLAKAMGYDTPEDAEKNVTYLPFGADDLHHTYYPTVSPVASGGYFWVFFDSIRNYGNLGLQRQLWGAAIDISADGTYTADPSHPAFYLSGQEAGAGNHRAFAALDACHKDGDSCTSGIDCCGGFCYDDGPGGEFAEPKGTCSPEKPMCANRDDRCARDADCCPPEDGEAPNTCIAGYCAFVTLI